MEVNGLCCFIFENNKAAMQEFTSCHRNVFFPVNLKPGVLQIPRLKVCNPSFYRPHKNKFAINLLHKMKLFTHVCIFYEAHILFSLISEVK